MERILLIGSGGREHALAKTLVGSASCEKLWVAPGNPGIEREAECVAINVADHVAIEKFCMRNDVTLVVVGPEQPLAEGLADSLRAENIDVFGPSRAAAQLETSKGFSKDFMKRHHVPTAPYRRFGSNDRDEAMTYAGQHSLPVVIKYDGLAAGKGVVVAETHAQAQQAVELMFDGAFGDDGIVVEGFLTGQEASVFAVCDGRDFVVLAPAQDHKRIGDEDTGKNTGGMGAYAPAPIVTKEILDVISETIIRRVLDGMVAEDMPFVGCLFCGLMIDGSNVSVVEFNVRFGDPETQAVMSVLDADVAALFASAARGSIDASTIRSTHMGFACNVVLASRGYPDAFEKGLPITGIEEAESDPYVTVYHAGTRVSDGELVTNGGRVLGVTAVGSTLSEAVSRSYQACAKINYDTKYHRTDIAKRAL
ncbi:MAG: phosphoribosylamine--glycine ligase [Candidatus Kapabacteria bacterium]|nr:phosphoribosylamine--glycine ligase [Candidatus Kapabacteria bacterium]